MTTRTDTIRIRWTATLGSWLSSRGIDYNHDANDDEATITLADATREPDEGDECEVCADGGVESPAVVRVIVGESGGTLPHWAPICTCCAGQDPEWGAAINR